ncbi:MAG: GNAT family N-acetyltransferase [Nocardioides sp.]
MADRPGPKRPTVGPPLSDDVVLRAATAEDLPLIADVYLAARAAAAPQLPPGVHSAEETREWVAGWRTDDGSVWVAHRGGVLGFARLDGSWLESLYVHPGAQGDGIGGALLDIVKHRRPAGFALWVFESNERARRFYRHRGLLAVRRTDGAANQERSPDVQMLWPGSDPVPVLRLAVDDLDEELARLLALRAGLTAAIQVHKSDLSRSGRVERDARREGEIVTRMARIAPELGRPRLTAIMDAVISASLDASLESGEPPRSSSHDAGARLE